MTFFEIDFYIYLYCQFYIVFRKNKFIMLPTLKYFMAILTLPNSLTIYLFNMCTVLSWKYICIAVIDKYVHRICPNWTSLCYTRLKYSHYHDIFDCNCPLVCKNCWFYWVLVVKIWCFGPIFQVNSNPQDTHTHFGIGDRWKTNRGWLILHTRVILVIIF